MYVCLYKQKTAYEMRISDWSSDVCSSDLMRDSGVTKRLPRLIGVQSDTMAPLVSRFTTGAEVGASAGAPAASGNPARPRGGAVTHDHKRSAERRVGKECVSTCSSRWSHATSKKKETKVQVHTI